MSKDWMFTTLMNIGFTESEVQVYLFLVENGSRKAKDLAEALGIHRRRIYAILRKLRDKGVVTASAEFPTHFSALLFKKVLDLLIEARLEQQESLKASKEELLFSWRSLIEKDDEKS